MTRPQLALLAVAVALALLFVGELARRGVDRTMAGDAAVAQQQMAAFGY